MELKILKSNLASFVIGFLLCLRMCSCSLTIDKYAGESNYNGNDRQQFNDCYILDNGLTFYDLRYDGQQAKIVEYDLSSGSEVYLGQYSFDTNDSLHGILIVGQFLISKNYYSQGYQIFNQRTRQHLGGWSIGGKILKDLIYSAILKKIFWSAADGTAGYFDQTSLPFPEEVNIHQIFPKPGFSFPGDTIISLSKSQKFLGLSSTQSRKLLLYNISSNQIAYLTSFPSGATCGSMTWETTKDVLYAASENTSTIIRYDTRTYVVQTSDINIGTTAVTKIYQIRYKAQYDLLIGVASDLVTNQTMVFSFNFFSKMTQVKKFDAPRFGTFEVNFQPSGFTFLAMHTSWYTNRYKILQYYGLPGATDPIVPTVPTGPTEPQPQPEPEPEQKQNENMTDQDQTKSYGANLAEKIQRVSNLIDNSLNSTAFRSANKVPGQRRILRPIFRFFGNFDDLWFYNYHPRTYNVVIQGLFDQIQQLQNQKWQLLRFQEMWEKTSLNLSQIKEIFNGKKAYTSQKFYKIEELSNGFIINTNNFLFSNAILTLAVFLVFNCLFRIFKAYPISKMLTQYSLWTYLFIMLMDGNLQFFAYILAFEFDNFFYVQFSNRISYFLLLPLIFGIFWFSIFLYFHVKRSSSKYIQYFFDNVNASLIGMAYIIMNFGLRNILLGVSHYFFDDAYYLKISILISLQSFFLCFNIFLLWKNQNIKKKSGSNLDLKSNKTKINKRKQKSYQKLRIFQIISKAKIWLNGILTGLIRIILALTFMITYEQDYSTETEEVFLQIHILLVYSFLLLYFVQIMHSFYEILSELLTSKQAHAKQNFQDKKKNLAQQHATDKKFSQQTIYKIPNPQKKKTVYKLKFKKAATITNISTSAKTQRLNIEQIQSR